MFKIEIIGRLLIQHNLSEYEATLLLAEEFTEQEKEIERINLISDLHTGSFITQEESIVLIGDTEDSFFINGDRYSLKVPFKEITFSAS